MLLEIMDHRTVAAVLSIVKIRPHAAVGLEYCNLLFFRSRQILAANH